MLAGARDSCGQDGRLTINATNGCNPYWMQSFGEPANFGYIRTKNCHKRLVFALMERPSRFDSVRLSRTTKLDARHEEKIDIKYLLY
jgi:hypothetical protein